MAINNVNTDALTSAINQFKAIVESNSIDPETLGALLQSIVDALGTAPTSDSIGTIADNIDALADTKLDKSAVVQSVGQNEDKVMSQKAMTAVVTDIDYRIQDVDTLARTKLDRSAVVQSVGQNEDEVMSQKAMTAVVTDIDYRIQDVDTLARTKLDKSAVIQSSGNAEDMVMSQKAVTEAIETLAASIPDAAEAITQTVQLYTDIEAVWQEGYIQGNGQTGTSGTWHYTTFPAEQGDYTLYTANGGLWPADQTFKWIYFFSSSEIGPSSYISKSMSPSFSVPEGCTTIAVANTPDDFIGNLRLANGIGAPFDATDTKLIESLLPSDIARKSEICTRESLDTLFGQRSGETYQFLRNWADAPRIDAQTVSCRYIGNNGGVNETELENWKVRGWWEVDELSDYTVYQDETTPWVDQTFLYVGCFASKSFDSAIGLAQDLGKGTHRTLAGTKYIALSCWNVLDDEKIKIKRGAAEPYDAAVFTLDPSADRGIGVDESSLVGNLKEKLADKPLTLSAANSECVFFIGNSYTVGGFQLKRKQYEYLVSMLTDLRANIFGAGGYSLQYVYERLLADSATEGSLKPSELNIKYAVIALEQNNSCTPEEYETLLEKVIALLEGRGAVVILSTEHWGMAQHGGYHKAMQNVAQRHGLMFLNWGDFAQATQILGFSGFKYEPAGHVGTRGYWVWANRMIPYLRTLDPGKSLKLYRNRAGVDFSTIPKYSDCYERALSFDELSFGGNGNTAETEKYVDRQQQGVAERTSDEYASVAKGSEVEVGSWMLAEFNLGTLGTSLKVVVDADNIGKAYVRKHDCSWQEVDFSAEMDLSGNLDSGMTRKSAILFKSDGSAIVLRDIRAEYTGEKASMPLPKMQQRLSGDSLISPLVGEEWGADYGIYTPVKDADDRAEPLPSGISQVAELKTTSQSLSQSFTLEAGEYAPYICQVQLLARFFPKFVATDEDWTTSEITATSCDMARVRVTVTDSQSAKAYDRYVGLWWDEVLIDVMVKGSATITITSPDGKNIQIASVRLVKQ